MDINQLACEMYSAYCVAVGGVAFNGDTLPKWSELGDHPRTEKVRDAWLVAARAAEAEVNLDCELKYGSRLAEKLVEHVHRMGASTTELPVTVNGEDYTVRAYPRNPVPATQTEGAGSVPDKERKHDSDCAVYNEPAMPNGTCNCSLSRS